MKIYELLKQIKDTSGIKAKLSLIQSQDEVTLAVLKAMFFNAYEPSITYYITPFQLSDTAGDNEDLLSCMERVLPPLSSREVTGDAATHHVLDITSEYTSEVCDILMRVLNRNIGVGVGATSINKVWDGLVTIPKYMRCTLPSKSNIDKFNWDEGIYVQTKMDALFFKAEYDPISASAELTTRSGAVIPKIGGVVDVCEYIDSTEILQQGVVVHGELLVLSPDGSSYLPREVSNGIVNSICTGDYQGDDKIVGVVWDVVDENRPDQEYSERFSTLNDIFYCHIGRSVRVVDSTLVRSKDEAYRIFKDLVADGKEGVILKTPSMLWKHGNNKDCVKLKVDVDVELVIVGFNEGDVLGRHSDTFGSLLCESKCGTVAVSVSSLKDDIRKQINDNRDAALGSIVTVRFNGITYPTKENTKHSLYLPRFIEIRHDKSEADDLASITEQFNNYFEA